MSLKKLFLYMMLFVGVANTALASTHAYKNSTTQNTNATQGVDYILHTVAKGETAYSIANMYKIKVSELYRLNPKAKDGIRVGEELLVPKERLTVSGYNEHIIKSQETLYGVSKSYGLSEEDIKKANPGLDERSFKVGSRIMIPVFGDQIVSSEKEVTPSPLEKTHTPYTVAKQETLYGISKKFNVTVDAIMLSNPQVAKEGLRVGEVIYIPNQAPSLWQPRGSLGQGDIVRVGVLLPFLDENGSVEKVKVVEFYEGLLLALKDAKAEGLNAEVYTFDIGVDYSTSRLKNVLETTEAKSLNLIIGGISPKQIDIITKFSKDNGIKYVVPFASLDNKLSKNPTVFQSTNSHSKLYPEVATAFKSLYPADEYNIIFLSEVGEDANNNKSDLIDIIKKSLSKDGVSYNTTVISSELVNNLKSQIVVGKKNVIVPATSSEGAIRKLMPALNIMTTENENLKINLFGYPEWQVHRSFTESFHKYDTHIYSIFYYEGHDALVKKKESEYKMWYGKVPINSYPKYMLLGYDTGLYFFTALNKYGENFQEKLSEMEVPTLQSAISYDRVGKGGYINNGLYIIRYNPEGSVEKIDCNRPGND